MVERVGVESSRSLVVSGDPLEFERGDDVVDVVESLGCALMSEHHHLLRSGPAGQFEQLRGGGAADAIVFLERLLHRRGSGELEGEGPSIEDRLGAAVRPVRVHGVGRVAEQRRAPEAPCGNGLRSTIGYSRISSAAAIAAGMSSHSKRQPRNRSTIGRGSTDRFQSASGLPTTRRSAMKFTR